MHVAAVHGLRPAGHAEAAASLLGAGTGALGEATSRASSIARAESSLAFGTVADPLQSVGEQPAAGGDQRLVAFTHGKGAAAAC